MPEVCTAKCMDCGYPMLRDGDKYLSCPVCLLMNQIGVFKFNCRYILDNDPTISTKSKQALNDLIHDPLPITEAMCEKMAELSRDIPDFDEEEE